MTDPIEAVCFDLDDTLYPYAQYARAGLAAAADHIASETGERYHDELHRLYFDHGVTDGTFDRLVDRHDLPTELVETAVEAFHSSTAPLEPYPETEPMLSALATAYRLGVITDGRGGRAKLRRAGIADWFDSVVVAPEINRTKADPRVFDRALTELSVRPRSTVYVGDDPRVDFRLPNVFGMRTVRLRRGRYTDLDPSSEMFAADTTITSLEELPAGIEHRTDESTTSTTDPGDHR